MMKILSLLIVLAAFAPPANSVESQKFKLITNPLALPPGKDAFTFTVIVLATGLPVDSQKPFTPSLVDAGTPASPAVQINTKYLSSSNLGAADQRLTFQVKIANFPPADNQSRVFIASYGNLHEPLTYTLTNIPTRTFSWSVKAASEWNLASMNALPISIHMGDLPASSVALVQADFISDDKQKSTAARQNFELCTDADSSLCASPATLAARSAAILYVRPKTGLPYGTLKGNLALFASEKADPEMLPVTIYSPRPGGILWGIGFLALGVLLASGIPLVLRPSIRRNEQKQVVLLLRKRLRELEDEFAGMPDNLKTAAVHWSKRAVQLEKDLSDKEIKDLMPSRIPQAFESEVTSLETFKSKIEELGANFAHLRTLLRDGLERVAEMQKAHPGHQPEMQEAAEAIAVLPPAADLGTQITTILRDLRTKAAVPASVTLASARPGSIQDEMHSVNFQLSVANLAAWVFWGAVSILSGALLLILPNPAFGTYSDLASCLAWGLGATAVGSQAVQVTPATVAGSLGIKVPGGK